MRKKKESYASLKARLDAAQKVIAAQDLELQRWKNGSFRARRDNDFLREVLLGLARQRK